MPITGGSAMEFETKRQKNNYFRSVKTIIIDGPDRTARVGQSAHHIHLIRIEIEFHESQQCHGH
jgi:surfactin synthase thioesterase subunit